MTVRDVDLSTSRIHRLLRPLRTKCASLLTFTVNAQRRAALNSATYSSRGSGAPERSPPLTILQPPESLGTRVHFDRHGLEDLEMSRKVYAIRDCFRDVVLKTKTERGMVGQGASSSDMNLATLCSIIVGNNLECETPQFSELDSSVDDIYNAIPLEYRRQVVISHALALILNMNIHYPTLLNSLLDISLDHRLVYESTILLHSLISVAFGSTSIVDATPCLCHPAHATFLQDIHMRWNAAGLPDELYFKVLIKNLESVRSSDAWMCKAVHNIARVMCARSFPLFTELIAIYVQIAAAISHDHSPNAKRWEYRLHKWMNMALNQYMMTMDLYRSDEVLDSADALLECLLSILASQPYHQSDRSVSTLHQDIQGMTLCLATCWLSTLPRTSPMNLVFIINRLVGVSPPVSTYTPLVAIIFSEGRLEVCKQRLEFMTSALRSYGLLRLEAALWACALRQIELPACERLMTTWNSDMQIRTYRHYLIEQVDDAENRCFGLGAPTNTTASQTIPKGIDSPANSVWQWEATIGCWVHKADDPTPIRKKGKLESSHPKSVFSACFKCGAVTTQRQNLIQCCANSGDKGSKLYLIQPAIRRQSNFTSLLSDAFANRTVLHTVSNLHFQPSMRQLSIHTCTDDNENQQTTLPSDDSLDLFSYRSSSPQRS